MNKPPLRMRMMHRRDTQAVLNIESLCHEIPWTADDLKRCCLGRNVIPLVVADGDEVLGYMIYEMHAHFLNLLNFAVRPSRHREGIGRLMISRLTRSINSGRRNRIVCAVRERNLEACLFFKSMGFVATGVMHDFCEAGDYREDAIQFVYRCPKPAIVRIAE